MPKPRAVRARLLLIFLGLLFAGTAWADDPKDLIERGRGLLSGDRHAEGEELLKKAAAQLEAALAADPKTAENQFLLGRALFYLGRDADAMAHFDKSIELSPGTARYHFLRAIAHSYAGDQDRAVKGMSRVLELDPSMADAWFERGRMRSAQGHKDEALADYHRAIQLNPAHSGALYNIGVIFADAGKDEEALAFFEKSQAADPNNADAFFNAGQVHQNHHRPKEALAMFLAAANLAPEDLNILKKVVQAHFALEQYDQAQPFQARLLAVREKSADPKVREMREYCFDQFDVGDLHVLAYETFDKSGDLYYQYTFKVTGADGNVQRTINLETSAVDRELGTPYLLGADEGRVHRTYTAGWKALPAYGELKPVVIQAIEGKLSVGASSERK